MQQSVFSSKKFKKIAFLTAISLSNVSLASSNLIISSHLPAAIDVDSDTQIPITLRLQNNTSLPIGALSLDIDSAQQVKILPSKDANTCHLGKVHVTGAKALAPKNVSEPKTDSPEPIKPIEPIKAPTTSHVPSVNQDPVNSSNFLGEQDIFTNGKKIEVTAPTGGNPQAPVSSNPQAPIISNSQIPTGNNPQTPKGTISDHKPKLGPSSVKRSTTGTILYPTQSCTIHATVQGSKLAQGLSMKVKVCAHDNQLCSKKTITASAEQINKIPKNSDGTPYTDEFYTDFIAKKDVFTLPGVVSPKMADKRGAFVVEEDRQENKVLGAPTHLAWLGFTQGSNFQVELTDQNGRLQMVNFVLANQCPLASQMNNATTCVGLSGNEKKIMEENVSQKTASKNEGVGSYNGYFTLALGDNSKLSAGKYTGMLVLTKKSWPDQINVAALPIVISYTKK